MTRRYSERIAVHCPVVFTMGSMVGEGEVVDLTNPGCLIQSTAGLKKGESLQLKMFLSGLKSPLIVALAVVRWTNGSRFGVEFIKMNEPDRAQLTEFISQHLRTSGSIESDRRQGSDRRGFSAQGLTNRRHG